MGIGGHTLLVFLSVLRTHLVLTKFHAYLLISTKTVVAAPSDSMTGVNFLFWLCLVAGVMLDFRD